MKTLFTWLAVFGLVIFGHQNDGGHINKFFNAGMAWMVLGPVLAFILISYGHKNFFKFCQRLMKSNLNNHDWAVLDKTITLGFMMGCLACVMHIIGIMQTFSMGNIAAVGNGFATAFIGMLYGLIPAVAFMPLSGHEERKGSVRAIGYSAVASFMLIFSASIIFALAK